MITLDEFVKNYLGASLFINENAPLDKNGFPEVKICFYSSSPESGWKHGARLTTDQSFEELIEALQTAKKIADSPWTYAL